jgi:hypothetical protein
MRTAGYNEVLELKSFSKEEEEEEDSFGCIY